MANKKISELVSRTPSLTDLMLIGDPSSGYSYKCTVTALATIIETDIADGYVTLGTTQTISGAKTFSNVLTLTSVANSAVDTDKFLVLNASNVVNYRTGSEVLSDIGGQGALTLTTTGTSGAATLVGNTLNIPNYAPDLSGYVPYTGATANVDLGVYDLTADVITGSTGSFSSSGSGNTFGITHSSGSGIALNITKGGNGEGLYVNKTSGSGNAVTIIGTLNATTLVKSGGTSSQYLMADGSTSTLTNPVTGTGTTNYIPKFTGASSIGNSAMYESSGTFFTSTNALNVRTNTSRANITTDADLVTQNGLGILATSTTYGQGYQYIRLMNSTSAYAGSISQTESTGIGLYSASALIFGSSSTERMRLDASGNLGLGVTPSAWGSSYKAIQISSFAAVTQGGNDTYLGNNWYNDGTNKYLQTSGASIYGQSNGSHLWLTAPSGTAGNAISFTQAMTLDASGRLGIGTSTPTSTLNVVSSAGEIAKFQSSNFGTGGTYIQFTNTSGNVGYFGWGSSNNDDLYIYNQKNSNTTIWTNQIERVRITSGGNVGIGTTSPTYNLVVSNNGAEGFEFIPAFSSNINVLQNYNRATSTWGTLDLRANDYIFRNQGTAAMTITSGGNVGIGTTSPDTKLQVAGTGATGFSIRANSSGDAYTRYYFDGTIYSDTYVDRGTGNLNIRTNTDAAIVFSTSASLTERMRITSGGNVGIGTSSPDRPLTVIGTIGLTGSGPAFVLKNTASADKRWDVSINGNDFAFNETGISERMRITSDGLVGIGTTNPIQKLEVAGVIRGEAVNVYSSTDPASTSPYLYSPSLGALGFGGNGSERMRITSGGKVLIGTTTDAGSYNLQVYSSGFTPAYFGSGNTATQLIIGNTGGRAGIGSVNNELSLFTSSSNVEVARMSNTTGTNGFMEVYGSLKITRNFTAPQTTKSAAYTLTDSDYTVGFDCTTSSLTATLPDATTCAGRIYVIYQYNTGTGTRGVTIDGNGAQTINGSATYVLTGYCDYSSVMIQSNGNNWIIISDALQTGCL